MKRIIYIILPTMLIFARCEEKTDFDLSNDGLQTLVVEGVITNELSYQMIRLSLPHVVQNGEPVPATGATVSISDGSSLTTLAEQPAGSGEYYTLQPFRALFAQTYRLDIDYNGKHYAAEDAAEPVEALTPFQYDQHIGENDTLYSIHFPDEGNEPSYTEYTIDWSNSADCLTGNCQAELIHYDLKTIDVHEIYKPNKEELLFPKESIIVRRKYSMSDSYRNFLRSVLSETEWRGGVFDIERANAPTNLSEGAIGFFAVSTVVSDTSKIQ